MQKKTLLHKGFRDENVKNQWVKAKTDILVLIFAKGFYHV